MTTRIAVLASGGGSNLQAMLDHFGELGAAAPGQIVYVGCDRAGAGALERARTVGIEAEILGSSAREAGLLPRLKDRGIDVVALAGYLRMVPAEAVRAFHGRIVNVHPALLPAFGGPGMYGHHVHAAVIARGVRVSGATVHFVDEAYDNGPIIAQWPCPVLPDDDVATLASRVLEVEHRIYPRVVAALSAGQVTLDEAGRVRVGPGSPIDFHFAGIARATFLRTGGPAPEDVRE